MVQSWHVWLLIALLAAFLEITMPYFTFIFASVGALVAMVVSFRTGLPGQIAAFVIALGFSMAFLRRRLLARVQHNDKLKSRSQALVGRQGEVTEAIDGVKGTGRITIGGQDWAARSHAAIPIGKTVTVEDHDGIVLIVKES